MVTSLQRLWSVADVSADMRTSLGNASCLSADLFDGTLVGGGGFGSRGGDNVLSATFLTFFVISQHPTRSWCYVMELVLATSNTNRVSWSSTRLQRPFNASPPTKIWASYVFCSSFPLNGMSICCRLFKSVDEMSINGKCKAHILCNFPLAWSLRKDASHNRKRADLERHWLEKLHERRCANLLLLVWVLWKNYSQRKTPYLQAQKSQWSSEHKELRSASAASESCLQRVLGWCRIFLGSSQRSDSEVETREAHRFCRWLPGAAKSSWSCHPPQKGYDPRLCDTAAQTGARWNGKRKQDSFIWAAGDKVAEGLANVSEGQLRRMGLLSTTARDKIEHHIVLCARYLNKEPGLERVLRALAVHRQKRQMD